MLLVDGDPAGDRRELLDDAAQRAQRDVGPDRRQLIEEEEASPQASARVTLSPRAPLRGGEHRSPHPPTPCRRPAPAPSVDGGRPRARTARAVVRATGPGSRRRRDHEQRQHRRGDDPTDHRAPEWRPEVRAFSHAQSHRDHPAMSATVVIRMGRNRMRPASMSASASTAPARPATTSQSRSADRVLGDDAHEQDHANQAHDVQRVLVIEERDHDADQRSGSDSMIARDRGTIRTAPRGSGT